MKTRKRKPNNNKSVTSKKPRTKSCAKVITPFWTDKSEDISKKTLVFLNSDNNNKDQHKKKVYRYEWKLGIWNDFINNKEKYVKEKKYHPRKQPKEPEYTKMHLKKKKRKSIY